MSINIQKNQLVSTAKVASLDVDYGPYVGTTLAEALAEAEDVLQLKKAEGKTIGVKIGDNPIKEYWLQYDSNNVLTFVEKAAYKAPEGGIPITDLSASVQTSLQKADSAIQNVDGKADKVTPATAGNLASLDANGNLIDSGKKILDFATSEQGTKANNAVSFAEAQVLTDVQRNTALANVSDQTANSTTGKMGYKVLNLTKTFVEQVTTENTIYEIRDVFEIGDDYTIPNGVTLKFNGGKLTGNGVLTFSMTKIEGNASIGCNFAGSIDDIVQIEWFGLVKGDSTFDNAPIINKVCNVFKRTSITSGVVYYSTKIYVQGAVAINWSTSLYYIGQDIDIDTIEFNDARRANIYIYQVSNKNLGSIINTTLHRYTDYNYALNRTENTSILRGITFNNINNSVIEVESVDQFNENIRICSSASNGISVKGNCYNEYKIGYSMNSSSHIRITQDNGGWCNANQIYLLRATNASQTGITNDYFSVGCIVGGDGVSSDTYNSCNNLTFFKCSTEGFKEYCYVFKNVGNINFISGRCETNATTFKAIVKCVGYARNINIDDNYYINRGNYFDFGDDCNSFSVNDDKYSYLIHTYNGVEFAKHIKVLSDNSNYTHICDKESKTGFIYNYFGSTEVTNYTKLNSPILTDSGLINFNGGSHKLAIKVDSSMNKYFRLVVHNCSSSPNIRYTKNSDGESISSSQQSSYGIPLGSIVYSYDSSNKAFIFSQGSGLKSHDLKIKVPSTVSEFIIFTNATDWVLYAVAHCEVKTFDKPILVGDTASRPTKAAVTLQTRTPNYLPETGLQYFDTDLGKYIVFNGTAWINLDGTPLS